MEIASQINLVTIVINIIFSTTIVLIVINQKIKSILRDINIQNTKFMNEIKEITISEIKNSR